MRITDSRSLCGACGLAFTSVHAFDKHRDGPYSARRCFSENELTAMGFALNARGLLRVPAPVGTFTNRIAA